MINYAGLADISDYSENNIQNVCVIHRLGIADLDDLVIKAVWTVSAIRWGLHWLAWKFAFGPLHPNQCEAPIPAAG